MSPQHEVFSNAIENFAAEQDDVKTAAAFAAGKPFSLLRFSSKRP